MKCTVEMSSVASINTNFHNDWFIYSEVYGGIQGNTETKHRDRMEIAQAT
jgi:hypothetical protein